MSTKTRNWNKKLFRGNGRTRTGFGWAFYTGGRGNIVENGFCYSPCRITIRANAYVWPPSGLVPDNFFFFANDRRRRTRKATIAHSRVCVARVKNITYARWRTSAILKTQARIDGGVWSGRSSPLSPWQRVVRASVTDEIVWECRRDRFFLFWIFFFSILEAIFILSHSMTTTVALARAEGMHRRHRHRERFIF